MSEYPKELNPTPEEMPDKISLVIDFTKEGKINVSGPITNEMLCFYLLEKARDIIKAHNLKLAYQDAQSKIQKPGGVINFARRRF